MDTKAILQKLLNSNSDSLRELERIFRKKYPEEKHLKTLLAQFIYSEATDAISDNEMAEALRETFLM